MAHAATLRLAAPSRTRNGAPRSAGPSTPSRGATPGALHPVFFRMPAPIQALGTLALAVACLSASPTVAARSSAHGPPRSAPAFEPAETLEGNYLAAYIAVAARDTAAAAAFYREALKDDPRNPDLLEKAFISLLADGAMPEAFRAADRMAAQD